MPYVDQTTRGQLDQRIDSLVVQVQSIQKGKHISDAAGVLNYICTSLALKLYPQRKYWVLALVVGVFVTVVLEYYRRWAAPYEDDKIKENGDVYPYQPAVGQDVGAVVTAACMDQTNPS